MQFNQKGTKDYTPMTLSRLLGSSSVELAGSVRACTELQWVISRLLEKSEHPDLVTEMHILQDIDRLQQTLADLACLLEFVAAQGLDIEIDSWAAMGAMRLPSLRQRIFGPTSSDDEGEMVKNETDDDVTWF